MSVYDTLLSSVQIPRFVKAHLEVPRGAISRDGLFDIIKNRIEERRLLERLKPGDTVAVGVGSRDINNYDCIVKSVVDILKSAGGRPFIFPAMGSHGGSTAEGQRRILESRGITEEFAGVPIRSSMETVSLGVTAGGLPVYMDKNAAGADWIVTVGRIRPHTDFHGRHESGLYKMLAVGCGKQKGAAVCHSDGKALMERNITEIASEVLKKKRILFGMAIVEDAFRQTYRIEAVPQDRYDEEDARLLCEAKSLIPRVPFAKVDLLVLNEFGKDISGAGMDPNVTGRFGPDSRLEPFIERIAALDLTEASHHNFVGIGNADVITQRFMDKADFLETYPNGITSRDLDGMRLPVVMPNDRNAVQLALHTMPQKMPEKGWRIVWMKHTLGFNTFLISEALAGESLKNPALKTEDERIDILFDDQGNLDPSMYNIFG